MSNPESMKELFARLQMAADASELVVLVSRDGISSEEEQLLIDSIIEKREYDQQAFLAVYNRKKADQKRGKL